MQKWYVKNTAGKIFGPIDLETLKGWVRDGRIEPLAGVSSDLRKWMLAPMKPELEMNWIVENEPGQFYGPTHRAVVEDLVKAGSISPAARFYVDDRGAAEEKIRSLEGCVAEKDAALAEKDAALAERDAAVQELGDRLREREAELEELRGLLAKMQEPHAREWSTDVVVPEVVTNELPPPVARQAFGPGGDMAGRNAMLADLERRAREELSRMGAARAQKFFKVNK